MRVLETGTYLGANIQSYQADSLYVNLTHYAGVAPADTGLHAHENPHLTLLLKGGTVEKRHQQEYERKSGDMVFFHVGEPHANSKTPQGSRNLNFEFTPDFFSGYELDEYRIAAAVNKHPQAKLLLIKAFRELQEGNTPAVHQLILSLIAKAENIKATKPQWVLIVQELLHDRWDETISLAQLSAAAGVHPVTISKHFSTYFSCTLGEYIRQIRIEKAIQLLPLKGSLTDIAYTCGFADPSHFNRTFKAQTGFLPATFRKL